MDVKSKAKYAYNTASESWHKSRIASLEKFDDEKLLKQNRPHLFIEKPAIFSKVPNLEGKRVLSLGCGSGEECEFLLGKKPKKLVGVDISEKLINIAKDTISGADFFVMDAEKLKFENSSFDYVYCSLMLDYFKSWTTVLGEVNRVLTKGGTFLFSNLHPVKWGADKLNDKDGKSLGALMGFEREPKTGKLIIRGDYLNTTIHEEIWMNKLKLSFYTKPINLMFKELVNSGFMIKDIDEPKAIPDAKKYDKDYWEINQKIPNFIIFDCIKI